MNLFKTLTILSTLTILQCSQSTSSEKLENSFGIYLLNDATLTTFDVKDQNIDSLEIQIEHRH